MNAYLCGCGLPGVAQLRTVVDVSSIVRCEGCAVEAIRRAAAAMRLPAQCLWCKGSMPVPDRPQGGGRTKVYCSTRCRTAAHRARPAVWGADTLHAVAGVEKA